MITDWENPKFWEKNLQQCHPVRGKSHTASPGTDPRLRGQKPATNSQRHNVLSSSRSQHESPAPEKFQENIYTEEGSTVLAGVLSKLRKYSLLCVLFKILVAFTFMLNFI
jgi:hypothetical protein